MIKRLTIGEGWKRPASELLLIIVGVLAALWIEDWRQTRIDRATEIEYLDRLTVDLEEDIDSLEGEIRHTRMRDTSAHAALEFLDSEAAVGDESVLEAFNQAGFISFFRYNRSTMDDLLSTGNMALLRDKELVRQLNDYYRAADFLLEMDDHKKLRIWREYRGRLDRHVPSALMPKIAARSLEPSDLTAVNWATLLNDLELRNGLGRVLGIAALERRMLNRVLEGARSLKAALTDDRSARSDG